MCVCPDPSLGKYLQEGRTTREVYALYACARVNVWSVPVCVHPCKITSEIHPSLSVSVSLLVLETSEIHPHLSLSLVPLSLSSSLCLPDSLSLSLSVSQILSLSLSLSLSLCRDFAGIFFLRHRYTYTYTTDVINFFSVTSNIYPSPEAGM